MDATKSLERTLRAHKQSLTAPRRAVFGALQHEEPLSMRELVDKCTKVDRASVYRTIALFEQLGVVVRLQTGWKYRLELSDQFHEHHHHATCLTCGGSFVIPEDPTIERHLRRVARDMDFNLERHQLELQGYCSVCTAKSRDN